MVKTLRPPSPSHRFYSFHSGVEGAKDFVVNTLLFPVFQHFDQIAPQKALPTNLLNGRVVIRLVTRLQKNGNWRLMKILLHRVEVTLQLARNLTEINLVLD